jgi:hypothetical protein
MKPISILREAEEIISADRERTHGKAEENLSNIATLWDAWCRVSRDAQMTPHDVAIMMALLKIARTQTGVYNRDDYVDAAGYIALAHRLAAAGNEE